MTPLGTRQGPRAGSGAEQGHSHAMTAPENPKRRPHFSCKAVVLGSRQRRMGAAPPRVIPTLGDQRPERQEVRKPLHIITIFILIIYFSPSKCLIRCGNCPRWWLKVPRSPSLPQDGAVGLLHGASGVLSTERLCWGSELLLCRDQRGPEKPRSCEAGAGEG